MALLNLLTNSNLRAGSNITFISKGIKTHFNQYKDIMVRVPYAKKNIEEKYTNSLTRLHTEITNNINFANGYFDATQKYFSISEDLLKLVNKGAKKSYDGINKIIESRE